MYSLASESHSISVHMEDSGDTVLVFDRFLVILVMPLAQLLSSTIIICGVAFTIISLTVNIRCNESLVIIHSSSFETLTASSFDSFGFSATLKSLKSAFTLKPSVLFLFISSCSPHTSYFVDVKLRLRYKIKRPTALPKSLKRLEILRIKFNKCMMITNKKQLKFLV